MRLIAKVHQDTNYGGEYRYIHSDVSNFGNVLGFNDKVSSIRIYRGNDYVAGDKIRFYQNVNFSGGYLDLGPGEYPNIHVQPFSFGDKISSADFLPVDTGSNPLTVRLDIHIYQNANFDGQRREILVSESRLAKQGFNDKVSSLRIFAGEDYAPGWVANFYQHVDYAGGILQPGNFGPGTNIANSSAAPYKFNDVISSIRIFQEDIIL